MMRVLNTELRLRFKNRKPRPFNRAASADDAATATPASTPTEDELRLNGILSMRTYWKIIGGSVEQCSFFPIKSGCFQKSISKGNIKNSAF